MSSADPHPFAFMGLPQNDPSLPTRHHLRKQFVTLYVQSRHPLPSHATSATSLASMGLPQNSTTLPPVTSLHRRLFTTTYYYYYSQLTSLQTPAWPLSQLFKPSLSHQ